MQALSINKSLSRARFSAEKGLISCKELTDLVIQAINEAGGRVDYAEVSMTTSLFHCFGFLHETIKYFMLYTTFQHIWQVESHACVLGRL